MWQQLRQVAILERGQALEDVLEVGPVLAKTTPAGSAPPAFRPDDALLTFLKNL